MVEFSLGIAIVLGLAFAVFLPEPIVVIKTKIMNFFKKSE